MARVYLYRYTDERGGTVEVPHETIRRPENPPLTEYNGRPVKLVITAAGIDFSKAGSGVYLNDYGRKE